MSPGIPHAAVLMAMAVAFPWCPSWRLVTGAEFLLQQDIIFLLTLLLLTSARILFCELS